MTEFKDRLRLLRKEKTVTQKQTAQAIGTSEQNYQRYERGTQQPTLQVLIDLSQFFDISIDYLTGHSDFSLCVRKSQIDDVTTYGLSAVFPDGQRRYIDDITTSLKAIFCLVDLLSKNEVEPEHFLNVIEDFMNQ